MWLLWLAFWFLAAFALGLGLGLLPAIIALARKPAVPVRGWLVTGILQVMAVGLTLLGLWWLVGAIRHASDFTLRILAGGCLLGPALFIRRQDRRRRPTVYRASPPSHD